MIMKKYVIGVDFGSLSARSLLVEIGTGREVATATYEYPHGIMRSALPDGTPIPAEHAHQHPQDYIDALQYTVHSILNTAAVPLEDIIGLGIDFTSNTFLPIDMEGQPLCLDPEYSSRPYAWVTMWQHHAAQAHADRMTQLALERGESFLDRCGGKISAEWMPPRLWHILDTDPELYEKAYRWIEAGDWINLLLTGTESRSANMAAYKVFWDAETGYLPKEYLRELDPRLEDMDSKMGPTPKYLGELAGCLNDRGVSLTGLLPGTAVAIACLDAHAGLPAAGAVSPGILALILGTSGCHLVSGTEMHAVPGLFGMAADGMIRGYTGYEAGQCCCGDHFKWVVDTCTPPSYAEEASARGISLHSLLTEKASRLKPGQSGLLALDWWNGTRSILMDANLSGLILGLTLQTKPEEIYRALIEATAYGTRLIIENFEEHGVPIHEIRVSGGIAKKNPMLMQIYADVLNRELFLVRSDQGGALGSAMFAAVAAGQEAGGYDTIADAAQDMSKLEPYSYSPIAENVKVYELLYQEYLKLHDYFGKGENNVMKRLREMKQDA